MSARDDHDPATFREYAATMVAVIIVLSYVPIGFLTMGASAWLGVSIVVPGEWNAAMLTLSSTALGYLFGKAPANKPSQSPPTVNAASDATITVTPAEQQ